MSTYATHFILIKKFLGWDKRIIQLRDGGFNIIDYENDKGITEWIQFNNVISINYQFGTQNELQLSWNKQNKSGEYKQTNWTMFSYDRDFFLSDYYRFFDQWREQTVHLRGSLLGPIIWKARLMYDYWFQASVNIEIRTSELILHLIDDMDEQTPQQQFKSKNLKLPENLIPPRIRCIPYVSIGLIVEYTNAIEFVWKSSHYRLTLFLEDSANVDELVQQIQKKQNQYLGFQNRVTEMKDTSHPEPEPRQFGVTQDINLDRNDYFYEQSQKWDWKVPQLRFQMFAWRNLDGTQYLRRVMIGFEDKTINEYDDEINEGQTILTLLQRYPLKAITHVVRLDFAPSRVAVVLFFKDGNQVSYVFEPFQRDVFITTLYHFIDCSVYSGISKVGCNKNDISFGILSKDSFSKVPISSSIPNMGKKVHGWPDNQIDTNYERYLLQQFCSSKDEFSCFENSVLVRLNLSLQNFKDNSPAPLVCVAQQADRVFSEYLKREKDYTITIRSHRIVRVMDSSTHRQMIEQLCGIKSQFRQAQKRQEYQNDLEESYARLKDESNPIWLALGKSLVCTYQDNEDNESHDTDYSHTQYERKLQQLQDASEVEILKEDLIEEVGLLMLKMEEILNILIKMIQAPNLYREFVSSRINQELYKRVLDYIVQISCRCPQPLVSFMASEFLNRICFDLDFKDNGKITKTYLFQNNFFTQLVHAISSYTLVHEADSYSLKLQNIRRQSHMTLNSINQMNIFKQLIEKSYPTAFLREELYTFHMLGFLRIFNSFVSPFSRGSTDKTELKIITQYIQTPYILAALNKMIHYKSANIQILTIILLGSLLDLLREQMFNPEVLEQQQHQSPCKAILLFSRNYELVQTLLVSRSTISIRLLIKIIGVLDSSALQYQISIWVISLLLRDNRYTSQLILSAFPIGLIGHLSQILFTENTESNLVLRGSQCYSIREAIGQIAQWTQSQWEQFFGFVSVKDCIEPDCIWQESERVQLLQQLKNFDYQFTYSQGAFLSQEQVDKILVRENQEEDFLNKTEKDLFSNVWNSQQFKIKYYTLYDLWEYIKQLPVQQAQQLFHQLYIAYMNPENLQHQTIVTKCFILMYKLYPSSKLVLENSLVKAFIKNGLKFINDILINKQQDNTEQLLILFEALIQHTEAIHTVSAVYVNCQSKQKEELRVVWQIYQTNILTLIEGGVLDLISLQLANFIDCQSYNNLSKQEQQIIKIGDSIGQKWRYLKQSVLDTLRLAILAFQRGEEQQHFLQPYPCVKEVLLIKDNGIRAHIILNQLIFEDEPLPIQKQILQIITHQLMDTQTLLLLMKIPIFVEAIALQFCSYDKSNIDAAIKIFQNVYNLFLEKATPTVKNRVLDYLNVGMFIRKVPYDEEKEVISYLPYLRILPFQLAKKIIHDRKSELKFCEDYNLIWNEELASQLQNYIRNNINIYKESVCNYIGNSVTQYPVYRNEDLTQFKFIQSELQCGHIFLRIWIQKGNSDRVNQITQDIIPYFTRGVTQMLEYFEMNLLNSASNRSIEIILKAHYLNAKLFKYFDVNVINKILSNFTNQTQKLPDVKKHQIESILQLCVLLAKIIRLYSDQGQKIQSIAEVLFKILKIYKQIHLNEGVNLLETILIKEILKTNPLETEAVNQSLILIQAYSELRIHSGSIVDQQFVESPEALQGLLQLSSQLGTAVLNLTQSLDTIQQLIELNYIWRIIYMITLFPHYQQEFEEQNAIIKALIIDLTFALRNIFFQTKSVEGFEEFWECIQLLFVPEFINTLIENAEDPGRRNDNDQTDVGSFLLKIASDTQEATLVWNEQTRRDLRCVLNKQICSSVGDWNSQFKNFKYSESQVEGVYLNVVNTERAKVQLPAGFIIKVAESAIKADTLVKFIECIKSVGILIEESHEQAKQIYQLLPELSNIFLDLCKRVNQSDLPDKIQIYFVIIRSYYQILNGFTYEEEGILLIKKQLQLLFELGQLARQATQDKIFLLFEYISLIQKIFDVNEEIAEIVSIGVVGIVWESLLKIEFISIEARHEVFSFFRILLQSEFEYSKNEEVRDQSQLETLRIAQGLPLHLLDVIIYYLLFFFNKKKLLFGDQDEETIMQNFYCQWSTPTLLWTPMMFKESLINVVQYNNIQIMMNLTKIKSQSHPQLSKLYGSFPPMPQILYTEIMNEVNVGQILLRVYNQNPSWPHSIPMNDLLFELSLACNYLFDELENQLSQISSSPHQLQHFDRTSCALVTYLTSFQLALEQVFYNDSHPQFTESLDGHKHEEIHENENAMQELSPEKISKELVHQRERVPQEVIKSIAKWCDWLSKPNIHAHIRGSVMQSIYIISDSEVGLVLLQETNFYNTLFQNFDAIFLKKQVNYTEAEKLLFATSLYKVMQKSFVRSNVTKQQMEIILICYTSFTQQFTQVFQGIMHCLLTDVIKSNEIKELVKSTQKEELCNEILALEQKEYPPVEPRIWRESFSSEQLPNYQSLNDPQFVFPVVSSFACEPLPHVPEQVFSRTIETNTLYEHYKIALNQIICKLNEISYENNLIQPLKYGLSDTYKVTEEKVQQKYSMISNEDIFI